MVPRAQEPPHSLMQMELVFWLTKKLSWKDGLNTLMVSLIGHHLSMMKLSSDYHRWNVIRCLMSSQCLWNCESNKTPVIWQGSRIRCNTCRDLQSRRSSRMQQLSTCSKGKGILKSVTIIEASLYCQLLGRSLLGSYWTDWMNTSNGQGFYQKASVDSGKTEEQ